MNKIFLEKWQPFLLDEEKIVQEFVLHALKEYPNVPVEWTNLLLQDVANIGKDATNVLIWSNESNVNADSVPPLIRIMNVISPTRKHLVMPFLFHLPPEAIVHHEKDLKPFINEQQFDFYRALMNNSREELTERFEQLIQNLEQQKSYDAQLFMEAKLVQNELFRKNWIDIRELEEVMKEQSKREWFTERGILAVRAIGLLKLTPFIPVLAELLARDEDILLEEAAEALIRFQSDLVVQNVKPYAMNEETFIFALSVLENTKTELAESALVECYEVLDEDGKGMVIEGLTHQLSEKAFPLIEDYLQHDYHYGMSDMNQILYGFYKVMGKTHPDSESWKASYEEQEKFFEENERRGGLGRKLEPVTTVKIGRNDPCHCGSGRKYKKCCGKA